MFHKYPVESNEFYPNRFFLVFNRLAGKNKKEDIRSIISLAEKNNIKFHRIYILPEEPIRYKDFEVDDIVFIKGGDGTTHQFLTSLIHHNGKKSIPFIAHMYGGSMCTVEKCLRIPERRKLIEKISKYIKDRVIRFIPRPSIHIEFENSNYETKYGFLFGSIVAATFLRDYYSYGETGPKTAIRTVLYYLKGVLLLKTEILAKFSPQKVRIKSEDFGKKEMNSYLLGASTVHSFGLNFSTFPKAPDYQDKFNFIGTSLNPLVLAFFIPSIYFGILPPGSINFVSNDVQIEFESKQNFTIDGDLYSAKNINLKIGPTVRFIT
ncbi:MAG: hypothetical protein NZ927_05330 [Candidatus Calescibacterium sp.]|nr:hypothetical protein [Candidatus Calescibacterium sp.]MCX7733211.1 diacylglycerol kinase family protein [bacterium]MDW8086918.1 diacylglycerol kinase family protein [Candidatus Calescibacterium sp.]